MAILHRGWRPYSLVPCESLTVEAVLRGSAGETSDFFSRDNPASQSWLPENELTVQWVVLLVSRRG